MPPPERQIRLGLQFKVVLILTALVVATCVSGGWFYYRTATDWLRESDTRNANRLGQALALSARHDLRDRRQMALQRLASDYIRNDSVRYVAILDDKGLVIASASRGADESTAWAALLSTPIAVSASNHLDDQTATLARPIVLQDFPSGRDMMVGAVRLVLDTSHTRQSLLRVRRRVQILAAATILCSIPLGYLLVWRIIVQPIRRLAAVTRHIASGDFSIRSRIQSKDEIGQLSLCLDEMTASLAAMREELVVAKDRLEQQVAQRTEELERANSRLREEMAEKEDFLRAVSHDLNAPLRNIAGMATLIMMRYREQLPEEVTARLNRIQANVDAQGRMLGELMELGRVKSCPQPRSVTDIHAVVQELGRTFEHELTSQGIELVVSQQMPQLYVEPSRIRQVFQNLLDNAIKYMNRPTGGRIQVGYEPVEGFHQFSVADNGPGVPVDQQQKIFHVFRRGENASCAPGKGVGLSLVKTIASNYDGRAWVQSDGEGATFFFTLSRQSTQAPQETAAAGEGLDADSADKVHQTLRQGRR